MLNNETFIDRCLAGKALADDINDYVDRWHESDDSRTLCEYLGFTDEEYHAWTLQQSSLSNILAKRKNPDLPLSSEDEDCHFLLAARRNKKISPSDIITWLKKYQKKISPDS